MTENNNIPKHWQTKKLGEVCDLQNGVAFKSSDYIEKSNTLIFRMSQIRPGGILDLNHNSKYLPDGFSELYKNYLLKDSDIVIAMTDMASETKILGVPTYFKSDGRNFLLNQRVGKLFNIDLDKINDSFLRYALTSPLVKRYYKSFGKGALQINLGKNDILNVTIPIPPLPEQQAIVSKIEELLSDLENGKQQLQTAQQQLKVYRQSLLKWAFEGKLTNKNVKDGELPKGWKWISLSELTEVKDGTHDTPKYIEEGIPFITQKNIRESGLSFSDIKFITQTDHDKFFKRSNVSFHDILISMIGANRGMTCLVNDNRVFSIKNVGLIKSNSKTIVDLYLLYFLKSIYAKNYVKSLSKGGAQEFIGLTELRKFPVVICSLEEQELLVSELESKLTVCDKIEETISQSLLQAETLKQSILKKAFEGRLVKN